MSQINFSAGDLVIDDGEFPFSGSENAARV